LMDMSDHVVIATGSKPNPPAHFEGMRTMSVDDVIVADKTELPQGTAVVFDEGDGFWPAYNAAERLVGLGWNVIFATPLGGIATRVPHESVGPLLDRLGQGGTVFKPLHTLEDCASDSGVVQLRPVFGGAPETLRPDLIVWHKPRLPTNELTLKAEEFAMCRLSIIGDWLTPRRTGHAIAEGYNFGAEI